MDSHPRLTVHRRVEKKLSSKSEQSALIYARLTGLGSHHCRVTAKWSHVANLELHKDDLPSPFERELVGEHRRKSEFDAIG